MLSKKTFLTDMDKDEKEEKMANSRCMRRKEEKYLKDKPPFGRLSIILRLLWGLYSILTHIMRINSIYNLKRVWIIWNVKTTKTLIGIIGLNKRFVLDYWLSVTISFDSI